MLKSIHVLRYDSLTTDISVSYKKRTGEDEKSTHN